MFLFENKLYFIFNFFYDFRLYYLTTFLTILGYIFSKNW